jgi:hypothetical protein
MTATLAFIRPARRRKTIVTACMPWHTACFFFLQADHRRPGGKPMMYRFNHFKEETDERWPMKIVKGF